MNEKISKSKMELFIIHKKNCQNSGIEKIQKYVKIVVFKGVRAFSEEKNSFHNIAFFIDSSSKMWYY